MSVISSRRSVVPVFKNTLRIHHVGGLSFTPSRCYLRAVLSPSLLSPTQAAADALVTLCETASPSESGADSSGPNASSSATIPMATEEESDCRGAVMTALVSQLDEAIDGITDKEAATPRLRFADTAARCVCMYAHVRVCVRLSSSVSREYKGMFLLFLLPGATVKLYRWFVPFASSMRVNRHVIISCDWL